MIRRSRVESLHGYYLCGVGGLAAQGQKRRQRRRLHACPWRANPLHGIRHQLRPEGDGHGLARRGDACNVFRHVHKTVAHFSGMYRRRCDCRSMALEGNNMRWRSHEIMCRFARRSERMIERGGWERLRRHTGSEDVCGKQLLQRASKVARIQGGSSQRSRAPRECRVGPRAPRGRRVQMRAHRRGSHRQRSSRGRSDHGRSGGFGGMTPEDWTSRPRRRLTAQLGGRRALREVARRALGFFPR